MTQCFKKDTKLKKISIPSKAYTKISLASLRSARGRWRNTVRNPGSNFYVVDRLLYNAQAAEADDLIRVEKVNRKTGKVILQPLLKKKFVVSLKDFERDYKIV